MSTTNNGQDLRELPVGELLGRLSNDTATLVRQEVELLRVETMERLTEARDRATAEATRTRQELTREVQGMRGDLQREARRLQDEVKPPARRAAQGGGLVAGGGVIALAALGALTACLILLLDLAMPAWAAALIVTVFWGLVATALVLIGRDRLRTVPQELRDTVSRAKDRFRQSATRGTGEMKDTVQSSARRLRQIEPPIPEQTVETLQEDVQWARSQLRSGDR